MTKSKAGRWPAWLGPLATVAVVFAVIMGAGVFGPQASEPIQGDQLGPERGESAAAYAERAAASLRQATEDDPRYALVIFAQPMTVPDAAETIDAVAPRRLNTVIPERSRPIEVPEPAKEMTRCEDVLASAVATAHREFGAPIRGATDEFEPSPHIAAVTVWDSPSNLEEMASLEQVWTVEAAPADAVWGNIALRPPKVQLE